MLGILEGLGSIPENKGSIDCTRNSFAFENMAVGAGEMAQRLRALTALPGDLGSVPSTHMAAHNCLKMQFPEI